MTIEVKMIKEGDPIPEGYKRYPSEFIKNMQKLSDTVDSLRKKLKPIMIAKNFTASGEK